MWRQSLPLTFRWQNFGVRRGQREVGERWWNRWRELGVAGNGTEQQSTVSHSVSSFSLIVSLRSPTCVNGPVAFLQGSHYSKDASFVSRLLPNQTKTNKNGCFSWFLEQHPPPRPNFLDHTPPWFGYQWSSWEESELSVCLFFCNSCCEVWAQGGVFLCVWTLVEFLLFTPFGFLFLLFWPWRPRLPFHLLPSPYKWPSSVIAILLLFIKKIAYVSVVPLF